MKRISVIGMGPGNPALLTLEAQGSLLEADIVIGARRLLEELPRRVGARRLEATRSEEILRLLDEHEPWQRACLLMSGDIGLFSGAKKLFPLLNARAYELKTVQGISSAQYFAGKLQRPWQSWRFLSAHGLECDILGEARRGGELFLVSGGENRVETLCARLQRAGMGDLHVSVGERLSYADERISRGTASDFAQKQFDALSVLLVDALPLEKTAWPWTNSGIEDECFLRGKVPMSKQEARVVGLAKLKIRQDDVLYDIGAGTGSVSVEMALLASQGRVFAIERKEEALVLIKQNAEKFNLNNVEAVLGMAPEALANLPAPQAAFIGGSAGQLEGIVDCLYQKNKGIRLCIACITVETLQEALQLLKDSRFKRQDFCQVSVSRSEPLGSYSMLKAQNAVFFISAEGRGE